MHKIIIFMFLINSAIYSADEAETEIRILQSDDSVQINGREVRAVKFAQFVIFDDWLAAEIKKLWNTGVVINDVDKSNYGVVRFEISFYGQSDNFRLLFQFYKKEEERTIVMISDKIYKKIDFNTAMTFFHKIDFLHIGLVPSEKK